MPASLPWHQEPITIPLFNRINKPRTKDWPVDPCMHESALVECELMTHHQVPVLVVQARVLPCDHVTLSDALPAHGAPGGTCGLVGTGSAEDESTDHIHGMLFKTILEDYTPDPQLKFLMRKAVRLSSPIWKAPDYRELSLVNSRQDGGKSLTMCSMLFSHD